MTGPALTVTLDDAMVTAASLPKGFDADDINVHPQDVQNAVNALWAGGAEAMMLMDHRVTATSAVRCVGNTLILQGRVYSPRMLSRRSATPVMVTSEYLRRGMPPPASG